jgi:hypothetical protein
MLFKTKYAKETCFDASVHYVAKRLHPNKRYVSFEREEFDVDQACATIHYGYTMSASGF